jgi:hypothetical protein
MMKIYLIHGTSLSDILLPLGKNRWAVTICTYAVLVILCKNRENYFAGSSWLRSNDILGRTIFSPAQRKLGAAQDRLLVIQLRRKTGAFYRKRFAASDKFYYIHFAVKKQTNFTRAAPVYHMERNRKCEAGSYQ